MLTLKFGALGYALIPQNDFKIHFWAAELALCTDLPLWLNASTGITRNPRARNQQR